MKRGNRRLNDEYRLNQYEIFVILYNSSESFEASRLLDFKNSLILMPAFENVKLSLN